MKSEYYRKGTEYLALIGILLAVVASIMSFVDREYSSCIAYITVIIAYGLTYHLARRLHAALAANEEQQKTINSLVELKIWKPLVKEHTEEEN